MKHKAQISDLVLGEHFEELPELLHFTADRHLLPTVAESCALVLVGDKHEALLRARSGMGNQALFLLVNHQENCNYFPATQFDPAFN